MPNDAIVISEQGLKTVLDRLGKVREMLSEQIIHIAVEQAWIENEIKLSKERDASN